MTEHTDVLLTRQKHLPHDGQELPGAPPPDAQKDAEDLIRSLIVEQKRETSPKRLPQLKAQSEIPADPAPRVPERAAATAAPEEEGEDDILTREIAEVIEGGDAAPTPVRRRFRLPRVALPRIGLPRVPVPNIRLRNAAEPAPKTPAAQPETRRMPRLAIPAALRGYRPTRKHVILAALALVVLWRPLLLPILAFVTFWLGLIIYLTVGPERCAEMGAGIWARFAARFPKRAERVRRRADAFAERFDRFLDRLPEPLADRLALPDFSVPMHDDPSRPDPFDRLVAQTRDA
ncbi:hypothetical protein [Roseovarius aestuariivivens]|uniref:hypothetical protein n=1 Tax=Roseovarius aestuariivivens TaxID=1888910 RepID=UPI00108155AC|nr:hypothetical protein [Roseovarius aestuariivivens]